MYSPVVAFTAITARTNSCLKEILSAIKDQKPTIKDAAFELIQAFLKLIENREEGTRKDLYTQIYNKAKGDFASYDALPLHGSLLIIEALLSHSKVDLQKEH